jgi:hypothetical protein
MPASSATQHQRELQRSRVYKHLQLAMACRVQDRQVQQIEHVPVLPTIMAKADL